MPGTVNIKGSNNLFAGSRSVGDSAQQIATASQTCREVLVKADPDNTPDLLIGNSASQTFQLQAGDDAPPIRVNDVQFIYAKSATTASATVQWLARD